jgi:hypothetical protein
MKKFSFFLIPLIILLVPLYPKFPLFGVSGTFVAVRMEDFIVALAFLVFGVYLFTTGINKFNHDIARSILLYWFIGGIATFSGILLTKTATPNLGVLHFLRRVEYMSLFFTGFTFLYRPVQLKFVIKVIILTTLAVSIYGFGQMYLGFPVISTNNSEFSKGLALQLGPGARINSTFAGHYDLAAFSAFPLLLILALLPISRRKPVLIGIWALAYWVLLMSASRVTFASFFASAAILVIIIRKRLWLFPLGFLAIVGILISPQLRGRYWEFLRNHLSVSVVSSVNAQSPVTPPVNRAVDAVPEALQTSNVMEDRSLNIRLNMEWPRAVRALAKNPVIGSGYSSVGLAVDNEYLRIMAETGLFGLLAFALIIIRFIKSSVFSVLHYQPSIINAFIVSVTCYLISLLLGGIFIDVFAASKIALFTWLMLGLAEKAKTFAHE